MSCSSEAGYGLRAAFGGDGRLTAVVWDNVPPGQINLRVIADGIPLVVVETLVSVVTEVGKGRLC